MWTFGTNELIGLISAISTFSAVVVSLYLANKSQKAKLKGFSHVNENGSGITLTNTGEIKFTITSAGIIVDKKYFALEAPIFSKFLTNSVTTPYTTGLNKTLYSSSSTEQTYFKVVVEPGDNVEIPIVYNNIKEKSKVVFFIVINYKIYKFKVAKHNLRKMMNLKSNASFIELDKKRVIVRTRYF